MDIWVYMLECGDGSYYVGLTRTGLERRITEHQYGVYRGYTYSRRPVRVAWCQEFERVTDAIACERQLKGWRREKKTGVDPWRSRCAACAFEDCTPGPFDKLRMILR
jgi:putative endonuclease